MKVLLIAPVATSAMGYYVETLACELAGKLQVALYVPGHFDDRYMRSRGLDKRIEVIRFRTPQSRKWRAVQHLNPFATESP